MEEDLRTELTKLTARVARVEAIGTTAEEDPVHKKVVVPQKGAQRDSQQAALAKWEILYGISAEGGAGGQ